MQTVKGPDRTPEEEITRMVNEHQLALLRLCFTYLHDKDLAKDAVQETFLKAYRRVRLSPRRTICAYFRNNPSGGLYGKPLHC